MFKQKIVSKKTIITFSTIFVICILLFCITIFVDFSMVKPINIKKSIDKSNVTWYLDSVYYGNHYVTINGWAFINKEILKDYDCNVVLKNIKTKESVEISTVLVKRDDLNVAFKDGTDYSRSGFFAKVNKYQIDLEHNNYEIYLKYFTNNHQIFLDTGHKLLDKQGA